MQKDLNNISKLFDNNNDNYKNKRIKHFYQIIYKNSYTNYYKKNIYI